MAPAPLLKRPSRMVFKGFLLLSVILGVQAQSPVFSQSSYYFTPNSCTFGTYLGQVAATGATTYSTDNSFVISITQSGSLSLGATVAAGLTFNVIATNQYGATQVPVTVNANCGGASGVAVLNYGTNLNVPTSYNVPTYNVPTYNVPMVQTVPIVVGGLNSGYYGNGYWGNNGYYGNNNNYGNTAIYSNGQRNCFGNKCYYGTPNNNNNNNWNYWNGYTFHGSPYNSYNTLGSTLVCTSGYCYNTG